MELSEADRLVLVSAASMVMALDAQLAEVERQILKRVRGVVAVRLLASTPGLGLMSAAALYAFLGDPTRLCSPKAVARYAGLDPAVYQSGQVDRIGHISKHGPALLRWDLVEEAWSVGRFDPGPLGQFYRRLEQVRGKAKGAVATARKLLVAAWALWRRGELYRTDQPLPSYARKLRELDRQAQQPVQVEDLIRRLRIELSLPSAAEVGDDLYGRSAGAAA